MASDNLGRLSRDIHRQAEAQEWDAEDNSEPEPQLTINRGDLVFNTADHSNSYISISDAWIQPSTGYHFQIDNSHAANINILDDGLEIEIDTSVFEPIIEDGKIILRRMFDEENNASQDNRAHEGTIENNSYRGQDMLQFSSTINYTQR